jgi:Mg2+ and Co2+ transporter CorA
MPELNSRFGYPMAVAAMLVVGATLYRALRRAGWL